MTTLPAPTPRSPPRYPDLYGKHRKQAELQVLNREIGFLEEELQSLEGLQPASRCCKEVDDFVVTNPDPLIPLNRKIHRSFCICKWLRCGHSSNPVLTYVGTLVAQNQQNDPSCACWPTLKRMKSCFNLSWLCCFSGCNFHLKWPACTCDPARYCRCCCSLHHCCRCRCHCRPCCCSCSCLDKSSCTSCCVLPRLSCPDCSCSCVWSCPKCTKVCCCPKCTRNCCIPSCCLCF